MSAKTQHITLPVNGMSCAVCANTVEEAVNKLPGVAEASVNFASHSLQVAYEPSAASLQQMAEAVQKAGYDLDISGEEANADSREQNRLQAARLRFFQTGLLALPVFVISMFFMDHSGAIKLPFGNFVLMVLTAPILFPFGKSFFINAAKQARIGKANMDTLVALSTGIAFVFSVFNTIFPDFLISQGLTPHVYYEAAAVIIAFVSLGKWLEERAKSGTSTALKKLMDLQIKEVVILENGVERTVPVGMLQPGNHVVVKPGQKIPVDGHVLNGKSAIDESMISGEAIPVEKQKDDLLFAGTINLQNQMVMVASAVGAETLLGQIIKAVEKAQGSKAPVQKFVDKIAGIFVPTVLVISVLTFLGWWIFGGDNSFSYALITSISVLVIACPCALGLATPTAIMVGIGRAAKSQILIRDAESIELASQVSVMFLDKTGTLTMGQPVVSDAIWPEDSEMLGAIKSMENQSTHPLAKAVVESIELPTGTRPDELTEHPGFGLEAKFQNCVYLAGNEALLQQFDITFPEHWQSRLTTWDSQAATVVYFAKDGEAIGACAIQDPIKPGAKEAMDTLKNQGITPIMLTGDREITAKAVADAVGIETYHANLRPKDKAAFIKEAKANGLKTAMVGDGINDSEALALADVAMAMGKGSDIAIDIAPITILSENVKKIPEALQISKLTVRTIRQNLFWAFIYNVIGIPIAAGLLYPINGFLLNPMIAAAAMAMSSVSVVTNSLRLRKG
jgi:P-type Cu2+ transporter